MGCRGVGMVMRGWQIAMDGPGVVAEDGDCGGFGLLNNWKN